MAGRIRRHWKGLVASLVAVVVVLVVGVPYLYIHVIEGTPPAPLSLAGAAAATGTGTGSDAADDGDRSVTDPAAANATATGSQAAGSASTATPANTTEPDAAGSLDGTWTIAAGSQAGYRVAETLAGQQTTAVGRTDQVSGSITVAGDAITVGTITVQVASIASDSSQRNAQFTGRIMDTDQYPTATFTVTTPIPLGDITSAGEKISATGNLTLHGTTKTVTFPLTVQHTDTGLAATGTIDIAYADYGIDNPSIGGFVSVGDSGTIEFLLHTTRG